jgi:hypothetical protein
MSRVQKILLEARRLSRAERRKVLAALERELRNERRAPRVQSHRTSATRKRGKGGSLYGSLLAIAGTVHSDFTDISSDKYKHVAAAALDERA